MPYFSNRVSEVSRNLAELNQTVPVAPVLHVPGALNPADVPTRSCSTVNDVSENSVWMSGPSFLYGERESMPLSRDFLKRGFDLPEGEVRAKKVSFFATKINPESLALRTMVENVLLKSWDLDKLIGTTARLIRASVKKDRNMILQPVTVEERRLAYNYILWLNMESTVGALEKGLLLP